MVDSDRLAPRVVVIGEALVDVVENAEGRSRHPGGSPMNVAFGLGRLGLPTTFVTEFSDDEDGLLLDEHLRSAGVSIVRSVDPEGTSTATARLGHDGSAHYDFQLRWDPPPMDVPAAEIVHTGSIAALREPGASTVLRALERASPQSLISFDPNIRPSLLDDTQRARDLVDWYAQHAAILKLSDEDADWLFPGTPPDQVLDWFIGRGVVLAAITLGARGSILRTPNDRVELTAETTNVVDTIGAGDAYMAGILLEASTLLRDGINLDRLSVDDLREIGQTASTVAKLTVQRVGAVLPDIRELTEALPQR